jgi:F0F1-type ATP synthase assembly protein I
MRRSGHALCLEIRCPVMEPDRAGSSGRQGISEAMRYAHLGIQLAASMVIFVLGGVFLDRWLDTTPWLTIGGAVFGIVALFAQLFRLSYDLEQEKKRSSRKR